MADDTSLNTLNAARLDGRMALQDRDRCRVERNAEGASELAAPADRLVLGDQLSRDFGFWKNAEIKQNGMLWSISVRPSS